MPLITVTVQTTLHIDPDRTDCGDMDCEHYAIQKLLESLPNHLEAGILLFGARVIENAMPEKK